MSEGYGRASGSPRVDVHSLLETIQLRISAADTAGAAALIEQELWQLLGQPELRATIASWLDALPPEWILASPRFCMAHVWLLLERPSQAQRWMEQAEQALRQPPWQHNRTAAAEAAALGAQLAAARGDDQGVTEGARAALEVLPAGHPLLTGVMLTLARTCLREGQPDRAEMVFAHATAQAFATGSTAAGTFAAGQRGALARLRGGLADARTAYTEGLMQAHQQGAHTTPGAGLLLIMLADLYRERNDLDSAQIYASNGVALARGPDLLPLWLGLLVQARIALARGDFDIAEALVQQLRQMPAPSGVFAAVMEGCAAQLALATAHLESATDIAMALPSSPDDLLHNADPLSQIYADEHILIPPLQVLITLGLVSRDVTPIQHATAHLAQLLLRSDLASRRWLQIRLRVLWALAQDGLGAPDLAMVAISEALEQAVGEGYARAVLDEGAAVLKLLRRFRDGGSDRAASIGAEAEWGLRSYAQHLLDW